MKFTVAIAMLATLLTAAGARAESDFFENVLIDEDLKSVTAFQRCSGTALTDGEITKYAEYVSRTEHVSIDLGEFKKRLARSNAAFDSSACNSVLTNIEVEYFKSYILPKIKAAPPTVEPAAPR